MKRVLSALAVALAAAFSTCSAADSKYLLEDPSPSHRVDYLIVSGDRFANDLDALAAHRSKQGYAVGIVTMSSVRAKFKSIRSFLAHAATKWKAPPPSYLLLAGDVESVPTVVKKGELRGWGGSHDLATDFDYARPLGAKIRLHVGRFPCDTPGELRLMIGKTISYETALPGGPWQSKLNFVASVGGFGKGIDSLLEAVAMQIVAGSVPPSFDVRAAYGSPNSAYCPYPPRFNEHVLNMFNSGSLLCLFAGHGTTRGVASLRWKGRSYPIFGDRDAKALSARNGLPVMIVVACHTGAFDRSDCLGETFLKTEKGPVAFIGGSRVTQPYANGLFAKAFVEAFFGPAKTLGEVLTMARRTVLAHRFSLFRLQADLAAAKVQGREALEPMRKDVVQHYNLLGDPALVIRRPTPDIKLTVKGSKAHIAAPGRAKVDLTLECDRLASLHDLPDIDPNDPQFEQKITDRYRKAHDKVIRRWTVLLKNGTGAVTFALPEKPGWYVLKASARGKTPLEWSVGTASLLVERKQE